MTVHTVIWKIRPGLDKQETYRKLKAALEALVGVVPGLISLELGLNVNPSDAAWDLVLRSVHENAAALEAYQVHPDHRQAASLVGELTSDRAVVDCEL
jgi:quinol monooxygenase YgiN